MFQAAEVPQDVTKSEYEDALESLRVDLLNAQYDLRSADFSVVVLLSGNDRPACAQSLKGMHAWLDQRYVGGHALLAPSDEERERPPFFRFWRRLPHRGRIGVFINAWDADCLRPALVRSIDDAEFERRLRHVRAFERALAEDGTLVLKYWFHLSKDALARRLKKARKDPEKMWWLLPEDELIHERFEELMPLAERLIQQTHIGHTSWTLIGSENPYYRDLAFAHDFRERLLARLRNGTTVGTAGAAGSGDAAAEAARVGAEDAGAASAAPRRRTLLDEVDLSAVLPKNEYRKRRDALQVEIRRLTYRAREAGVSTVLVFEGWDAAGKGGVIRRVTWPIDARLFDVHPIAAPTEHERSFHYLWRFWTRLPHRGRVAIFDRSWYGRVLVERVEGLASEEAWRRAYAEIVEFEDQLVEAGAVVQKFWLHIDPDEQMARFLAREATPFKKYKITEEDYRNRERWDDYARAVEDMVARTSTDTAPWHLVAANDKRHARIEVMERVAEALAARL